MGALLLVLLSAAPLPAPGADGLLVERGEGLAFRIPDDEVLDYAVVLDVALVGETVAGSFQLSAGTEEVRGGERGKLGWIRAWAAGTYLNYTLDHLIEARIMPQEWPRGIYRDTQRGSRHRRKEVMYGRRQGKPVSWYRRDHHCDGCDREEHTVRGGLPLSGKHHCKRCKRAEHQVWRQPTTQEIPEHALDMLSAVLLARAMVSDGRDEVHVAMLDKEKFWEVTFARAERADIETPAGIFRCRAIKLTPELPEGAKKERFKGLFGIHGTLSLWLEERTGVPVRIEGVIPVGIFEVGVSLDLKAYEGTPAEFGPVE